MDFITCVVYTGRNHLIFRILRPKITYQRIIPLVFIIYVYQKLGERRMGVDFLNTSGGTEMSRDTYEHQRQLAFMTAAEDSRDVVPKLSTAPVLKSSISSPKTLEDFLSQPAPTLSKIISHATRSKKGSPAPGVTLPELTKGQGRRRSTPTAGIEPPTNNSSALKMTRTPMRSENQNSLVDQAFAYVAQLEREQSSTDSTRLSSAALSLASHEEGYTFKSQKKKKKQMKKEVLKSSNKSMKKKSKRSTANAIYTTRPILSKSSHVGAAGASMSNGSGAWNSGSSSSTSRKLDSTMIDSLVLNFQQATTLKTLQAQLQKSQQSLNESRSVLQLAAEGHFQK